MTRRARCLLAVLTVGAAALLVAPSAGAEESLGPVFDQPTSPTQVPPTFRFDALHAEAIAEHVARVREQKSQHPGLYPVAYIVGPGWWEVDFFTVRRAHGHKRYDDRIAVNVSGKTGQVFAVWTGAAINDPLARGHLAAKADSWWIWAILCIAFVLPFANFRRPLRLLHVDLLAILALGVSYAFYTAGNVAVSVPLVYPVLIYLFARTLMIGLRTRRRHDRLVPHLPMRWLAGGLILLVAFRIGLNVANGTKVLDVGYAGVIGAYRILHGLPLYVMDQLHGDTYGPVNYLVYAPFEAIFPWHGRWDTLPAAHATTLAIDLATIAGLILLGRRMRPGRSGTKLGLALAWAWAACPFTMLLVATNVNDGLVAMLLVYALLAMRSGGARGTLVGLGAAAKFAPIVLAPLFMRGVDGETRRTRLLAGACALLVPALTFYAYLPHGGVSQLWSRTIGFQMSRVTDFSIWAQHPALHALQILLYVAAGVLVAATAVLPRRRDVSAVAGLGAAILLAIEIPTNHWFYFYFAWGLPLALVALFAAYTTEPSVAQLDEIELSVPAASERVALT